MKRTFRFASVSIRVSSPPELDIIGTGGKIDINYSLSINNALGPENRLSFSADLDNLLKKDSNE